MSMFLNFKKASEEQLLLIEFLYNNIYQSSTVMSSFEALYDKKYITQLC